MSDLTFHWFLPTNGGDGRQIVGGGHGTAAEHSARPATIPYLGQVARSAEQLGFEAALTPTGAWCEDAWITTAMINSLSERLKREGMIQEPMPADATERMKEIKQLADRFGLPL